MWLNKLLLWWRQSKPFDVKLKGRSGLTYFEETKRMEVDSEMLVGEYNYVVFSDSICSWSAPNENITLSKLDKNRILKNIVTCLQESNIRVQVYDRAQGTVENI